MAYDEEDELTSRLEMLTGRIAELEERVARLEALPGRTASSPVFAGPVHTNGVEHIGTDLTESIRQALGQLGEGEAGAIRQQMIKNGGPASLSRGDVNKALYNRKDLFEIVRQEGAKPIWHLSGS